MKKVKMTEGTNVEAMNSRKIKDREEDNWNECLAIMEK